MTIRDKVNGSRVIPLTPYLSSLLMKLKHINENDVSGKDERNKVSEWVFFSKTSATGWIAEPRILHVAALKRAGLPHISLHGLRRSFGTLSEWCECPVGVVAQFQGHKPSALAEKHYRRRPIDLLRMWHDKIEKWMLDQAGITFGADVEQLSAKTAAK